MPEKPEHACLICGSNSYWLRNVWGEPEWVCSVCHPQPAKEEKTEVAIPKLEGKFATAEVKLEEKTVATAKEPEQEEKPTCQNSNQMNLF